MSQDFENSALDEGNHAFGEQYGGEALLKLLAPKKGEQILDLGCGRGYLTARIADSDACVQGIDSCSSRIGRQEITILTLNSRSKMRVIFQ